MGFRETDRDYDITSFSRLELYQKCPEMYKYQYVEKYRPEQPFAAPLVRGSFVHDVLEEYIDPDTLTSSIEDALYLYFGPWLEELHTGIPLEEAWDFANKFGDLLFRASPKCNDPKLKIRKADGTVPSNLESYPTKSWKSALQKSGLSKLRYEMDNKAGLNYPDAFINLSFSYFVGETFAMLKGFEIPAWIKQTVFVEKGFSTNQNDKLLLPGSSDLYFNGYMDWVAEDQYGQLIILDHKTSKKKPSEQQVQNFPQLNLYAWGYKLVYGIWPNKIGIHHVRSGEIVLANVDKKIVNRTLVYYGTIQKAGIESGLFIKRHPEEYGSPCIQRDRQTDKVSFICPYLHKCWPEYLDSLELAATDTVNTNLH